MELTVPAFMKRCIDSYEALRGKVPSEVGITFWDAVVMSAADEEQAAAFREQIIQRKEKSLIPLVPYHVFSDPPGPKVGSGGATLHILEQLRNIYGEEQSHMRILLIHTGGQSKRLPSHSALGKLFALLPVIAATELQMFDLKMAMYSPFLAKMRAGVFLTCSDDIETYTLPLLEETAQSGQWSFDNSGFTALAHPSPISVGLTHGVYVLPEEVQCSSVCLTTKCLEVLQKPTEKLMHDKGAIFKKGEGDSAKEFVYTDSVFFFDCSVVDKLVKFYTQIKPVTQEIDAYRDFLQLLGSRSRGCVSKTGEGGAGDLPRVQQILQGCELHIVVLPLSRFYHLGTMQEYIENLCFSETFAEELQTSRFVHSKLIPFEVCVPSNISGVIMHSLINPRSTIPRSAVVEHCRLEVPIKMGDRCILSNCRLEKLGNKVVEVPGNAIIFTISIKSATWKGYATLAFGIDDDLKLVASDVKELSYFGKKLGLLENSKLVMCNSLFTTYCAASSLWEAKLFSLKPTMTEAFLSTLELVQAVVQDVPQVPKQKNSVEVSMEDVLKWKDIRALLRHQSTIFS
ncbi:fucose-1-phosphate guanylyltransferase-like [Dermacentor variabilis]|uniref:fucose-1-phosphate guanylyltransferase-like n=1 Tax=Dermacentor variabilis TaxID=34621 RepID=UPI003F5B49AC